MLTIRPELMLAMQKSHLTALRQTLVRTVHAEFPALAKLHESWLDDFARQAIDSARTIWIDESSQVLRYGSSLFYLHCIGDRKKMSYFCKIMLSEESAEARLRLVEQDLPGPPR